MSTLTLGQLIDTMKIGDIARSNRKVTDIIGYYFVKREESGFYVWNGRDIEDYQNYHQMKLEKCFTQFEWEILPRYISFDEAMKASKDGKPVKFHSELGVVKQIEKYDELIVYNNLEHFSIKDLLEGNWSIVD